MRALLGNLLLAGTPATLRGRCHAQPLLYCAASTLTLAAARSPGTAGLPASAAAAGAASAAAGVGPGAGADSPSSSSCTTTRLGRPCVAFGPNDFGVDPESKRCQVIHPGPFPLCYVSESRDEVGVCAESCARDGGSWRAPVDVPHDGKVEPEDLGGLVEAVELVREGELDEAEAVLTKSIKNLLVREKYKKAFATDGDSEQDTEDQATSVLDLVSAAHSLRLLAQINHDQGMLGRAQIHFEMGCRLLDQIYGAPFETPDSYSSDCYAELLDVLHAQHKHRRAMAVESYMEQDDELFPVDYDSEYTPDDDEDDGDDEQDDTLAMLKAIIRSFARASPAVRVKLTDATEEEVVPGTASRFRSSVSFVKDVMKECNQPQPQPDGKDSASMEHCREHVDTEVESLLASLEYSKKKVDDANFLLEMDGGGPMCLPQQQLLRSKNYELSMLLELAIEFQSELADAEDEAAEAKEKVAPAIPWTLVDIATVCGVLCIASVPVIQGRCICLRGKKGARSIRDKARKTLAGRAFPEPDATVDEDASTPQSVELQAEVLPSAPQNARADISSEKRVRSRPSKKEMRRQRRSKKAAEAQTQNARMQPESVTLAREVIHDLLDSVCKTGKTDDFFGETWEPLVKDRIKDEFHNLWEEKQRGQPATFKVPRSPVWSVRSSDSDGSRDGDDQDVDLPDQEIASCSSDDGSQGAGSEAQTAHTTRPGRGHTDAVVRRRNVPPLADRSGRRKPGTVGRPAQTLSHAAARTRHGGRDAARPQQPRHFADSKPLRKKMLTAAEVLARDAAAMRAKQEEAAAENAVESGKHPLQAASSSPTKCIPRRSASPADVHKEGRTEAAQPAPPATPVVSPAALPAVHDEPVLLAVPAAAEFAAQPMPPQYTAEHAYNDALPPGMHHHLVPMDAVPTGVTAPLVSSSPWPLGAVPGPPIAPLPKPAYLPETLDAIRRQVEYYLSDDNLATDMWLRSQMGSEGWIDLELLATFNRVRSLTTDLGEIFASLQMSHELELQTLSWSPPAARVRRRQMFES